MSNRDDFDFDDDLFGDDDGDDLRSSAGDDFDFEDDPRDEFSFEDESNLGFDDVGDNFDQGAVGFDEAGFDDSLLNDQRESEPQERRGPSRAFILLMALMIVIFLVGLGLLISLLTRPTGPSVFEMTEAAIVSTNNARLTLLAQTQTQAAQFANQTATATLFTATPSPTFTATPSPTPTEEASPTPTQRGGVALFTETPEPSPTQEDEPPPTQATLSLSSIQLTATALVSFFNTPVEAPTQATPSGGQTTSGVGGGTGGQLPDTGLFDDLLSGQGLSAFFMMAFGLVGIIVLSRRARAMNNRK